MPEVEEGRLAVFKYDTSVPRHHAAARDFEELWKLTDRDDPIVTVGVGAASDVGGAVLTSSSEPAHVGLSSSGLGHDGLRAAGGDGRAGGAIPTLVIDIDGDGSFQMNIQEMGTCICEKLPVKVLLLNNQHLGMVVQWEDRFMQGNRAHTYLGPIDNPEASGKGDGLGPQDRYPDFVAIAKGYGWGAAYVKEQSDLVGALQTMIEYDGPYLLDVEVPYQEHVLPMIPSGMTVKEIIKE